MKKKILFISDVPDFKGGAEKSLFDLMLNPHIEPILIVPSYHEIAIAANEKSIQTYIVDFGKVLTVRRPFKLLDIPRTFISAVKAAAAINKIAKEHDVTCMHSNGLKAHGIGAIARIMGGKPLISHIRSIPYTPIEKIFWQAIRLISAKLILVSRPCWHGNNLPKNIKVIFNGINLPKTNFSHTPGKPFIIGFAGRLQFTKGVDTLIEWFTYSYKNGLDIKLLIKGEAAPDEQEYKNKLEQMVIDNNLSEVCIFLGKIKKIEDIYNNIDINVVSSIVPDPLPRSVMEACAFGIPVIRYPSGGIPYMIEDKKSGFLVKNKEEFFTIVKELINHPTLYQTTSNEAIKRAKECFPLDRLHQLVNDAYNSL